MGEQGLKAALMQSAAPDDQPVFDEAARRPDGRSLLSVQRRFDSGNLSDHWRLPPPLHGSWSTGRGFVAKCLGEGSRVVRVSADTMCVGGAEPTRNLGGPDDIPKRMDDSGHRDRQHHEPSCQGGRVVRGAASFCSSDLQWRCISSHTRQWGGRPSR